MLSKTAKDATRQKVHTRIRKRLAGTSERPRLNVYRSENHIYAQVIDDANGVTLVHATSLEKGKGIKGEKRPTGGNVSSAKEVGKLIAQRAKEKGINKVVFDRGGYLYHGRIKALADAAREAGLEF
jgi:large subunit ribosomal protein L18